MYLQIRRKNPDSDLNPYVRHHWVIGSLTNRQLRWLKFFTYKTRSTIAIDLAFGWLIVWCAAMIIMGALQISMFDSSLIAAPIALAGFSLQFGLSLRARGHANELLTNRDLMVNGKQPSWIHLDSTTGIHLCGPDSPERVEAITQYFRDTAEHDKLLNSSNIDSVDYNRIVDDMRSKARGLLDEMIHLTCLDDVMISTQEELAVDAAPFDEVLASERKAELHERVNQLLNHHPR